MAIYITGDTHGDKTRFWKHNPISNTLQPGDYLIICGDFGYIFFANGSERNFLDELAKRPYTILFCDGNHENFNVLDDYPVTEWCGGKVHRVRNNIFHLMRGQSYNIEGKTFFVMGGAYSVDRDYRILGMSYWEQEIPTTAEIDEAFETLVAHNFNVDYIITHTCPKKVASTLADTLLDKDGGLLKFFDLVNERCKYKHWYFGHWHIDKEITDKMTAVYCNLIRLED